MAIAVLTPDWSFHDRVRQTIGGELGELVWANRPRKRLERRRADDGWIVDADAAWKLDDWLCLERVARTTPILLVVRGSLPEGLDGPLPVAPESPLFGVQLRSIDQVNATEVACALALGRSARTRRESRRIDDGTVEAPNGARRSGDCEPRDLPLAAVLQVASEPVRSAARRYREAARRIDRADGLDGRSIAGAADRAEAQRAADDLLRQIDRLQDGTLLWDDRLGIRRETLQVAELLERALRRTGRSGSYPPAGSETVLRVDRRLAEAIVVEMLEALPEVDRAEFRVARCDGLIAIDCWSDETIAIDEFAELQAEWNERAWPAGASPFTWELGLARERARCQGGDFLPARSDEGRFGWRLILPEDDPAGIVRGYLAHLARRLPPDVDSLGAFVVQTDADGERRRAATDVALTEAVGSCGLVLRRGDRTWIVVAPVGEDETGEFVQWLQQRWTEALGGSKADAAPKRLEFTLAISTCGHVLRSDGPPALLDLLRIGLCVPGPMGDEAPILVISRGEPGLIDGLSRRLAESGCSVTRVEAEAPCPEEWSEDAPARRPVVFDLRQPEEEGWSRLDELVRAGALHRQVYLLTEDLRRQNDRLANFGAAWADGSAEAMSAEAIMGNASSRGAAIDAPASIGTD